MPLVQASARPGSRLRIEGTSSLQDWQVESRLIGGFLEIEPGFLSDPIQPPRPGPIQARAKASILVRSLKSVDKGGGPYSDHMDEVMYEHLKATEPAARIVFDLYDLTLLDSPTEGPCLCEAKGTLAIAGITNRIAMPVALQPAESGSLRVSGETRLRMTSFNILPPATKIAAGLIRAGDEVKILFDWLVAPRASVLDPAPGTIPKGMVPLILDLPTAAFKGTPKDIPLSSYMEPLSEKPRPPMLVPAGLSNVAVRARITCSDKNATPEALCKIVDGDKEPAEQSIVYLRKGTQWVQLDLGARQEIFAIALWHAHNAAKVYHDVIVQTAEDPGFTQAVRTLFNNDQDNTSGMGVGIDREYFETFEGKLINAKGVQARFLRFYSKGSTESALNEYTEIEVYGRRAR